MWSSNHASRRLGGRSDGHDICDRILNLRSPEEEPQHEDQLSEEQDGQIRQSGRREQVRSQSVDEIGQAIDREQRGEEFWDVARSIDQIAKEPQMDAEYDHAECPVIAERNEQQLDLSVLEIAAKRVEVFGRPDH